MITILRKYLFPEVLASGEDIRALKEGVYAQAEQLLGQSAAAAFWQELPSLRAALESDLQAALSGDPAASDRDLVIACYPGFYAVTVYRVCHILQKLGQGRIARILSEEAHSRTGIDIHPGAVIGDGFFIDHGTGVVIGQTTAIGRHVTVYQGVTLGAISTRGGSALRDIKRHPTVEDDVILYANATVLGGDTVIGRGSVIGAGAFVAHSLAPHSRIPACGVVPYMPKSQASGDIRENF